MKEISQKLLAALPIEDVTQRIQLWIASLPPHPAQSLPSPSAGPEETAQRNTFFDHARAARSSIEQAEQAQRDELVRPLQALTATAILNAAVAHFEAELPHPTPTARTGARAAAGTLPLTQQRVSAVTHSAPASTRTSFMSQHLPPHARSLSL